jgi:hypothetical protein
MIQMAHARFAFAQVPNPWSGRGKKMGNSLVGGGRGLRLFALVGVVSAIGLAFWAAPAFAAQGSYSVTQQDGIGFPLLSTRNLVTTPTADDVLYRVGTTMSGAAHMPFSVKAYNTSYSKLTISSNGNVQFGVCCSGGNAVFTNAALPAADFPKPAFAVFWDDLYYVPGDTGHFFREGIFTKVSGSAPHRRFVISWQGHSFNSEAYFVLAQVVFNEGSQTVQFRYGASDLQGTFNPSETIGVQGTGGVAAPSTQVAFNPPFAATSLGRQYTFTHH